MYRSSASKLVMVMLSLNATLLLAVGALLLTRTELLSSAGAQSVAASSPSQELVVAPGQLSSNAWGCYVVDTQRRTICVYQYNPLDRMLRLQASRGIEQDVELKSYNTQPLPSEIAELVKKQWSIQSGTPTTAPSPETGKK